MGVWTAQLKQIDIRQLNMAGYLNDKVLRATGNLSVRLDHSQKSLLPQQFQANQLFLAYAKNQATGNAQNLRISVDAFK